MDFLNFLQEQKRKLDIVTHPYAKEDLHIKYLYCFGVAIMTLGNMKAINETEQLFAGFLQSIQLPKVYQDKLISDINGHFELKVNQFLNMIMNHKKKQYFFIADLLMIRYSTLWSEEYCNGVILQFMDIFRFTNGEREFLKQFVAASKKGDQERAKELYQDFSREHPVEYQLLQYITPNFRLVEHHKEIELMRGEKMHLDRETVIDSDVYLTNGSLLSIHNANVKIGGTIYVDGGRIHISNSNITATKDGEKPLLYVINVHDIDVVNSVIDLQYKKNFIKQTDGDLYIAQSKILHCKKEYAIQFEGNNLECVDTVIRECHNGGIHTKFDSRLSVKRSQFIDCVAEQGGAIFADSLNTTEIDKTTFTRCRAIYMGAGVYFPYKKYGQVVTNSVVEDCVPADTVIFNDFNESL